MSTNKLFESYRQWLGTMVNASSQSDIDFAKESFAETIMRSPAYHPEAIRNGEPQPIVASRTEMRKCKLTVIPGTTVNVGDLIEVFNERWICVSLYQDEYEMIYGELWLCNIKLTYQDFSSKVINKYAILDDGSYSKGKDTSLPVESNYYNCYISLDEESEALTVDKRLALDKMFDSSGNIILDVGKIAWVDRISNNFGNLSHLLVFGLKDDVYNAATDNTELMICDYKHTDELPAEEQADTGYLVIAGKDTIRIGTKRKYMVSAVDSFGNSVEIGERVTWSLSEMLDGVSITQDGAECAVNIQLNSDLIGRSLQLICVDANGVYATAKKELVVIQVG